MDNVNNFQKNMLFISGLNSDRKYIEFDGKYICGAYFNNPIFDLSNNSLYDWLLDNTDLSNASCFESIKLLKNSSNQQKVMDPIKLGQMQKIQSSIFTDFNFNLYELYNENDKAFLMYQNIYIYDTLKNITIADLNNIFTFNNLAELEEIVSSYYSQNDIDFVKKYLDRNIKTYDKISIQDIAKYRVF